MMSYIRQTGVRRTNFRVLVWLSVECQLCIFSLLTQ